MLGSLIAMPRWLSLSRSDSCFTHLSIHLIAMTITKSSWLQVVAHAMTGHCVQLGSRVLGDHAITWGDLMNQGFIHILFAGNTTVDLYVHVPYLDAVV
jgi:hypothetical protein